MNGEELLRVARWATQRTHANEREDDAQEVALRILERRITSPSEAQRCADNVAAKLRSKRRRRVQILAGLPPVPGSVPGDLMGSLLYTEEDRPRRPAPSELALAMLPEVFRTRTFAAVWSSYHAAREQLTHLVRRGRVVRIRQGVYRKAV